jgi:prevent-host-death family protein
MRSVQAAEAKTHLSNLLDEVESGRTIVITRHGKAIARLIPEADSHRERVAALKAQIEAFRKSGPKLTLDEILSSRHEGHKY